MDTRDVRQAIFHITRDRGIQRNIIIIRDCALIYYKTSFCRSLGETDLEDYQYHVFDERTAEIDFIESLPTSGRIRLTDPFIRQRANADYRAVPSEKFSEWHLPAYNKVNEDFGDFSVQGDHFLSVGGNNTKTVAIHHIHYPEGRKLWYTVRHTFPFE